ncbi:FKBP-type peptidyl-prolyl cis-trans isomerase SlyD [Sinobacterium caligoides]|uniref:Peptidyl-prolyl cis-trans isomerase n=1 Tax=Sinobacterium caligoides TaxID=933926 RepID=A0A3N2DPW5_9GAMM|nr:peptidylprolyl isomerase [Sinobacterium caligoides]ROS01868.1 FKBP-type peptidyl-prolyl cis-trans isomerase SlyD [Sinobacterium caligoides]
MIIEKDKVVSFQYILSDSEGHQVDASTETTPMCYLHGHSNILPKLEQALAGAAVGDQLSITLEAVDAYGPYKESLISRVAVKAIRGGKGKRLQPGTQVYIDTEQGEKVATVIKAGKFQATVDGNHPLAGRTLCFSITVSDIREAHEEELSHGHAHGVGGHQH